MTVIGGLKSYTHSFTSVLELEQVFQFENPNRCLEIYRKDWSSLSSPLVHLLLGERDKEEGLLLWKKECRGFLKCSIRLSLFSSKAFHIKYLCLSVCSIEIFAFYMFCSFSLSLYLFVEGGGFLDFATSSKGYEAFVQSLEYLGSILVVSRLKGFLALAWSSRRPLRAAWSVMSHEKGKVRKMMMFRPKSFKYFIIDSCRCRALTICKARDRGALTRGLMMSLGGADVASISRNIYFAMKC